MDNNCENCGECCLETEMILSSKDIELIMKNSIYDLQKKDFFFKINLNHFQLKNFEGHCIFFDLSSKKCKIYEFRPQGCRFYPLIYDTNKNKCTLDLDCPRKEIFYPTNQAFKITCFKLKQFLKNDLKVKIR